MLFRIWCILALIQLVIVGFLFFSGGFAFDSLNLDETIGVFPTFLVMFIGLASFFLLVVSPLNILIWYIVLRAAKSLNTPREKVIDLYATAIWGYTNIKPKTFTQKFNKMSVDKFQGKFLKKLLWNVHAKHIKNLTEKYYGKIEEEEKQND